MKTNQDNKYFNIINIFVVNHIYMRWKLSRTANSTRKKKHCIVISIINRTKIKKLCININKILQ